MTPRLTEQDNREMKKRDIIKALNQTILTVLLIIVPVTISFITNPTGNKINDILIAFIFGIPILIRLIVYSINN
jgi:hypothetical protein